MKRFGTPPNKRDYRHSTMKRNVLIWSSAAWGLSMFAIALYEQWARLTLLFTIVLFVLCLCSAALWGAVMYVFLFAMHLYVGRNVKTSGAEVIHRRMRLLKYCTWLLAMFPVIGGAFVWPQYFWPSLVAGIGPTLLMLPLAYRRRTSFVLGSSFVAGILLGTAIAIGVFLFEQRAMYVPSAETMLFCSLFALSWGTSQLLPMLQYKVKGT
jgi:hypothetical protein